MRQKLLISVSAIALMAGAGFAAAQDKGGPGGAQGGGASQAPQQSSPAQQSAPSVQPGGGEMKGGGAEPKGGQAQQRDQKGDSPQRAQDQRQPDQKGAQDQRNQRDQKGAQEKSSPATKGSASDTKSDKKGSTASDTKSSKDGATTGQGAAGSARGASLTTEQRTKITTTIRQTNVRPVTNVNFNISVGTVVPRSVTLHALPATVIEVYPEWRPYRFVLVGDEILIIEPDTYRIVAVIDA